MKIGWTIKRNQCFYLPPPSNLTLFSSKTVIAIVYNAIDVHNVHKLFVDQENVCCFMYERYVEF
jgi:hypothetical protein